MPTQVVTQAIAGPFKAFWTPPTASWGSTAHGTAATLGVIGDKGVRQIRTFDVEEYTTDLLGSSVVEGVYMGGNMFLEFELEEVNLNAVKTLMMPFVLNKTAAVGTASAESDPSCYVGVPGTFATSYCGSLELRPLYASSGGNKDTKAANQTTPVRVYESVTLAGGFQQEQLFSSKRRTLPFRLRCYPYVSGTEYVWFKLQSLATDNDTYQIS